jgi:hypothetical protein
MGMFRDVALSRARRVTTKRKRRTTHEDSADSDTCPWRIRDALATFTGLRCTICSREARVRALWHDDPFRR